jgi:hypothetical protein
MDGMNDDGTQDQITNNLSFLHTVNYSSIPMIDQYDIIK